MSGPKQSEKPRSGFVDRLVRLLRDWTYQYGQCKGRRARRHRLSREVQFVLWARGHKIGDYTYTEDYLTSFDSSWWNNFLPNAKAHPQEEARK